MKIRIATRPSNRFKAADLVVWPALAGSATAPAQEDLPLVKRWTAAIPVETLDAKKVTTIKDTEGNVLDYRDVRIRGYLSTFGSGEDMDRHGEYVERGAFKETLERFMQNPVMLTDHANRVESLVGSWPVAEENAKGLYVEGLLSNAPGVRDVRFKVMEGSLRTMSMGGLFHYKENRRSIFLVDLWEGSLTPIPANPKATFHTRSLTPTEAHYAKTAHLWGSYYDFVRAVGTCEPLRK